MLLGSPPDMVHGALSHRTRISAYQSARLPCFITRQLYHIRPRVASRNPFPFPRCGRRFSAPARRGKAVFPPVRPARAKGAAQHRKRGGRKAAFPFPMETTPRLVSCLPAAAPFSWSAHPVLRGRRTSIFNGAAAQVFPHPASPHIRPVLPRPPHCVDGMRTLKLRGMGPNAPRKLPSTDICPVLRSKIAHLSGRRTDVETSWDGDPRSFIRPQTDTPPPPR